MFMLLVMGSVVAGVTEEVAFRGYMQTPLERRFGLTAAIFIPGIAFGILHFPNHSRDVLVMLPYYVAVTAVYGGIPMPRTRLCRQWSSTRSVTAGR